ncbi:hypothetical protein FGO68_gene7666 [Halteria grandinella]|uniref:Uncharacterized protein n=1 Tax=Halteria grandinella TaxID=5974 RepID=A0A8J8NLY6_HALGN|nr:hypothetical protein FGO68_gene7666 [Halteria grandinella]
MKSTISISSGLLTGWPCARSLSSNLRLYSSLRYLSRKYSSDICQISSLLSRQISLTAQLRELYKMLQILPLEKSLSPVRRTRASQCGAMYTSRVSLDMSIQVARNLKELTMCSTKSYTLLGSVRLYSKFASPLKISTIQVEPLQKKLASILRSNKAIQISSEVQFHHQLQWYCSCLQAQREALSFWKIYLAHHRLLFLGSL